MNSVWFDKTMVHSDLMTSFVLTIAMEGLCDKYGEDARCDRNNWTALKNKKYMGDHDKCPPHNIQLRQASGIEHIEESKDSLKLEPEKKTAAKKSIIEVLPEKSAASNKPIEIEPRYKIIKEPNTDPVQLNCKIMLPGVSSVKDIALDVGEDRIVVKCSKTKHLLDIFLPHNLDNVNTSATFIIDEHTLNVTIPLV